MKRNLTNRIVRLMKERTAYHTMLSTCQANGYERLSKACCKHIHTLDSKLIKAIKPNIVKEDTVGEITDSDIARARDYPIENLFEGKTKAIRCPFHDDKNPSASIKNNRFKCFVCNMKPMDSIAVYMKIHGVGFVDAVKQLR